MGQHWGFWRKKCDRCLGLEPGRTAVSQAFVWSLTDWWPGDRGEWSRKKKSGGFANMPPMGLHRFSAGGDIE